MVKSQIGMRSRENKRCRRTRSFVMFVAKKNKGKWSNIGGGVGGYGNTHIYILRHI